MTRAIRDAAQALLLAHDACATLAEMKAGWDALRVALAAPEPTDEERVAEHMRLVNDVERAAWLNNAIEQRKAEVAVEASARALLAASRQDAEHAAMYRWLRDNREGQLDDGTTRDVFDEDGTLLYGNELDSAIRAAMKEPK